LRACGKCCSGLDLIERKWRPRRDLNPRHLGHLKSGEQTCRSDLICWSNVSRGLRRPINAANDMASLRGEFQSRRLFRCLGSSSKWCGFSPCGPQAPRRAR
jgi:hypothetical protein